MIKEIIRLNTMGLGSEKIAQALGISRNTVRRYIRKNTQSKMENKPSPISEAQNPPSVEVYKAPWSNFVDWSLVKKMTDSGTQLRHFWEDEILHGALQELQTVPYVSFWREFKRRFPTVALDLHREFPPGERCEADFKGKDEGLGFFDVATGVFIQCYLFGNILPFSQLSYVEATLTQKQSDFLSAFANSFQYFGGVPSICVVDNAKVGVSKAHRYDPDFNPEFTYFCEHFDTGHVATVAGKPKHKCFVENMLGVFWRWAGPKIRSSRFESLAGLNKFLRELLDEFNQRVQKKYGVSRRERFESSERSKLFPLPSHPFQSATWKKAKPHPDSHIQVGHNFYSVPHSLRGQELEVRITHHFAEIFFNLERVAIHLLFRGNQKGRYQTNNSHLPPAHQAVNEFTPQRALIDAKKIGPMTLKVIENLFSSSKHPLIHLRRAQGIIRMASRYLPEKVEEASTEVIELGLSPPRLRHFEEIVKHISRKDSRNTTSGISRGPNPNLRGQSSFDCQSYETMGKNSYAQ